MLSGKWRPFCLGLNVLTQHLYIPDAFTPKKFMTKFVCLKNCIHVHDHGIKFDLAYLTPNMKATYITPWVFLITDKNISIYIEILT